MSNPEAKVILTAQDRTATAFRSAKANLESLQNAAGKVQGALGAIGIGVSLAAVGTAIGRAAKSAIEFGDQLQKAAARTGIGASEFGVLADAAKMADVEMQTLSKGLRTMQVAISEAGSGGKAQVETFKALGLTFADLAKLKPAEQFLALVDQISKLESPADRARAGTEAFGKAWQDLAPFAEQGAEGIRKATEQIRNLGGALTDDQIAKLGEADTAIKNLDRSWSNFARTLTAAVAPALTEVLNRLAGTTPDQVGTDLAMQLAKLQDLQARREPYTRPGYDKRVLADLDRQIEETKRNIGDLRLKLAEVADGRGRGPLRRRNGPAPSVTPPGFGGDGDRAAYLNRILPGIEVTAQKIGLSATQELYKQLNDATKTALEKEIESWTEFSTQVDFLVSEGLISGIEGAKRLKARLDEELPEIKITASKILPPEEVTQMSIFAEQAARNMQDAFAGFFYNFEGGLKGMLGSFVDTIRRMVAELLAQQVLLAFFNWGAGQFTGTVGNTFANMAKGIKPKALGGPVSAGSPYWVGEKGPELFVPRSSGSIIPNGAGGAAVFNYTIDARGADAERIMAILPPLLRQTEERTIAHVRDLNRRGRLV